MIAPASSRTGVLSSAILRSPASVATLTAQVALATPSRSGARSMPARSSDGPSACRTRGSARKSPSGSPTAPTGSARSARPAAFAAASTPARSTTKAPSVIAARRVVRASACATEAGCSAAACAPMSLTTSRIPSGCSSPPGGGRSRKDHCRRAPSRTAMSRRSIACGSPVARASSSVSTSGVCARAGCRSTRRAPTGTGAARRRSGPERDVGAGDGVVSAGHQRETERWPRGHRLPRFLARRRETARGGAQDRHAPHHAVIFGQGAAVPVAIGEWGGVVGRQDEAGDGARLAAGDRAADDRRQAVRRRLREKADHGCPTAAGASAGRVSWQLWLMARTGKCGCRASTIATASAVRSSNCCASSCSSATIVTRRYPGFASSRQARRLSRSQRALRKSYAHRAAPPVADRPNGAS